MSIALWAVQGLLALAFLATGFMKAAQPIANLAKSMKWVPATPVALVRFIGVAEILGALGLILPGLTHIAPMLIPIAAIGLAIIMILAIGFHTRRAEYQNLGGNATLLVLALLVIIGRFTAWPLA
jgi:uncharacterized membrane protein YphA (DoxX/SURF4 family)